MNSWIPKNKIVRIAASVALLSIVLYFVGLFIVLNETKKLENLYGNTESESSKEQKFLAIKSVVDANQDTIQTLKKFFVQKGDEVKFIEQIEGITKNSGIKFNIVSIDVKAGGSNDFKEDIAVKMQTEGAWTDTVSFISKLERLPFGISITGVDMSLVAPGQWSTSVDFIIFREK
jgi:hypothetical protein